MQVAVSPFTAAFRAPAVPAAARPDSNASPQVRFGRDEDILALSKGRTETEIRKVCAPLRKKMQQIDAEQDPTKRTAIALKLSREFRTLKEQYELSAQPTASDNAIQGLFHEIGNLMIGYVGAVQLLQACPEKYLEETTKVLNTNKKEIEAILKRYDSPINTPGEALDNAITHALGKIGGKQLVLKNEHNSFLLSSMLIPTELRHSLLHGTTPQYKLASNVDLLHFYIVISNWLSNAVKYTPSGSITVQSQVTKKEAGKPMLEIKIQDTGSGMSDETIQRLNHGIAGRGEDVGEIEGSGIGASIATALLREMGGQLKVELRTKQTRRTKTSKILGTDVTLSFPLEKVAQQTSEKTIQAEEQRELVYA